MISNFLEIEEFRIDISELYLCIKSNRENIDKKLILEFRNRVEDFMISNKEITPEAPFSKDNWEYIRGKYKYFVEETINGDFVNVDYFFNRQPTPKELFDLNEWEVFEKGKQILLKISSKKVVKSIKALKIEEIAENTPKEKEPRFYSDNWWDYSFDIYSYFQPVQLPINFTNSDFQYFFAWYLTLIDPIQIDLPFMEALMKTSGKSKKQLVVYFDLLSLKFSEILNIGFWVVKKQMIYENLNIGLNVTSSEINDLKRGRPIKKELRISKSISRKNGDNITTLNTESTAILFNYLKKQKLIISNNSDLSQVDLSNVIAVLTGYSETNIYKYLMKTRKDNYELNKVKEQLLNLIDLINSDLKKSK